jgi:hypothetical protein
MGTTAKTVLAVVVVAILTVGATAATPRLQITSRSFSKDAVLTLDVVFESPSEITVYSWRGHIYPLLGFGLTITANDPHGRALSIERVAKIVPKLPHAGDTATASTYRYPEPLLIQLLDERSQPWRGCADVQIDYDLTSDPSGNFRRAGLDLLHARSNEIRVCNAGE